MTFSSYFRISSYAMVACGALALAVSGGMSLGLAVAFSLVLVLAWNLESTRWQLPERIGLLVVLLSLPLFYLDWQYLAGGGGDARSKVGVGALAHLILFLSAVKLLQVKADRDWVFLYLISFFEVLLAAGLSISPLFLATLGLYMLCALSTIVSLEIKKARRGLKISETRLLVAPDSTLIRRLTSRRARRPLGEARRLPLVACVLLVLIFALAMPLFLVAPRFGSSALARSGEGIAGMVGFSDHVTLGQIGRLQQGTQVVMRVRVEDSQAKRNRSLRWRGVALDLFQGNEWQRSTREGQYIEPRSESGLFQLGTTEGLHRLTTQTFFIEPIDTPVLFAAPRAVALQGALPYVREDGEGALSTRPHGLERISYKAHSDTTEPDADALRADSRPYPGSYDRYLKYPETLDPRIKELAREMIAREGARTRYDMARAIEAHLQHDYRYTLELKAGGPDPLADFLFRVREGHCEYFATAMAILLRTQGIATRVVNGFQMGEYNDAADAYTVTQRDAHSWVEVYFPERGVWVTFDPTPAAGRPLRISTGFGARLGKYAEALELLWMQYVVSYDRQEQRSLATSLRNGLDQYRRSLTRTIDAMKAKASEWLDTIQRGKGSLDGTSLTGARGLLLLLALALSVIALPLALLLRRVRRLGLRRGLAVWQAEAGRDSTIDFYERMTSILAARGLQREANETPLEFASAAGIPEVLKITEAYHRVRYGAERLTSMEIAEINECLNRMESERF